MTDKARDSGIRLIMELQDAAAAELRNLRRALRKPVIRARMANMPSRDGTYLAMHEALPNLATGHKNAYRPVVDEEYSCPVCYVRHGEHFALRESIISDGTVDAPMRKVIMQCDGCGYSTVARTSADNAAPWHTPKCDNCMLLSNEPTSRPPHPALVPDIATFTAGERSELHYRCEDCGTWWERPLAKAGYLGNPLVRRARRSTI